MVGISITFGGFLFLFYFSFLSIFGQLSVTGARSWKTSWNKEKITSQNQERILFHILIFIKFLIISRDFSVSTKKKENRLQLSYLLSIKYLNHFSDSFLRFERLSQLLPLHTPIGQIEHCMLFSILKPWGVGDDLNWLMRNQRINFGSKRSIEKGSDADALKSFAIEDQ